jgi:hypothetical protein
MKIFIIMDEQGKWLLEIESAPNEEATISVEMTTQLIKQRQFSSGYERYSIVGKMLSHSIECDREIFRKTGENR